MQSAQALTSQANQTTDTSVRATLSSQFDALVTQIGQLAGDAGFNGINLLGGDTLTVTLDETGSSTTSVVGVNYMDATAAPLNITLAAGSWASSANIQAATDSLTAALTSLRSESQTLSANLSTVQIRQDFTKATINTLQTGSADLTLANFEPGRREPACLANSPAAIDHRAVTCFAGRPERVASVPINRSRTRQNGGLRAAVFLRASRSWLTNY